MKAKGVSTCLAIITHLVMISAVFADDHLYFAQFGGGGGLISDIVLTNPSPQNKVVGRVDFYDADGSPLWVPMEGKEEVSGAEYTLEPLGTVTLKTLPQGDLRQGTAVTTSDGPLGGVIRFQIPGIGVAGVGVSQPVSTFVIPARRVKNSIGTGIAIHNPTSSAVNLQLTLRDNQAAVLETGGTQIPAFGQKVGFIETLFPESELEEYEGTLTVQVEVGSVAGMALELGPQPGELTTLPVTPVETDQSAAPSNLYFAQFGNGGGLESAIVLVNPHVSQSVSGKVEFFDDAGNPLMVGMQETKSVLGQQAVSSLDFSLSALGSVTFLTDGAGGLVVGSAQVEADGPLGGVIRYEIEGIGTTAVPESSPTVGSLVPVRKETGGINTGIALQNVGDSGLELELILRDAAGKQLPGGQTTIEPQELPARGHLARFFDQLFPHAEIQEFTGTISVESRTGSFAASSLEMGEQAGEFTTLPVTRLEGQTRKADTVGAFEVSASYVVLSLDNAAGGVRRRFHFGESNPSSSLDSPLAGDFDGDGKDTIGFFNYREGRFYLANSNVPGVIDKRIDFLPPDHNPIGDPRGWVPIAGDWSGSGFDQLGAYHWHTSTFYFLDADGEIDSTLQFGEPKPSTPPEDDGTSSSWPGGPYPLTGDWDGDGIDGVGVCYLGVDGDPNLFHLKNDFKEGPADLVIEFGPVHGYPVTGDWDGDGIDTIGLFDSITKTFYLKNSLQSGSPDHTLVLDEGPFFECMVCNRLPAHTIPGVFPITGVWDTRGDATPSSGYDWPTDTPENHGLDSAKLEVAKELGEQLDGLRSLLVVRNGHLVWESYFRGLDGTITQNIKSVSKGVLSALFGIAFDKGYFPKVSADPRENLKNLTVDSFFPEFDVPEEITLFHLLTMSAGLEIHGDPPAAFVASLDWVRWTLTQPMSQSHPLGRFNYTTCLTQAASELLTRVTGMPTLDFAKQELFEPLGISVTRWDHEPNPTDSYNGGWEMFMRPRDMARFGQLFLQAGRIDDGTQLISSQWVAASVDDLIESPEYGLWWWIGGNSSHEPNSNYYWGYYGNGWGGQRIFVFPSLKLVVVMTSLVPTADPSGQAGDTHWLLRYVLDAVKN